MDTQRKLKLIAERAREDRQKKFTALAHHINEESLTGCYRRLKKNKACGIDGVSVEEYGTKLQENLKGLIQRLKDKSYRPQPVKRVYIPKAGKKEKRPLGIPTVEDKLVQMMLKDILETIFEQDFMECSYGFRPGRSVHTAIKKLDQVVMKKPINAIVEVDIRKFFDEVKHYWVLRGVEERVKDPNQQWLVRKFLKAGIIDEGVYKRSKVGTPQGGVVSPLLANIYLHYALDQWFEFKFKPRAKGYVELIRYCDDFVVACEEIEDAENFLKGLKERLAKYGLRISEEKTGILKFGRKEWKKAKVTGQKVPTFDFLGFTHYCMASRKGWFTMGHKTARKKYAAGLKETKEWLRKVINYYHIKEWWPTLLAKLRGHYNFYGINGNMRWVYQYYQRIRQLVFKWINRRSQKRSMTWEKFTEYLERYPLPKPKVCVQIYT